MRKTILVFTLLAMFCLPYIIYAANLDDFNGNTLNKMWTYRDPKGNGKYTIKDGKMTLELKAGADMYIQGVDGGVCFLMDPPNLNNFSIEMMVNPAVSGTMPPACQPGLLFFNEAKWAYSIWGPYANTDIRLEDCIGGSYRWRAQTLVGIDTNQVKIDKDVYLKVTKTGDKLEFFAKDSKDDKWLSGGTDTKLGPNYTKGDYKIGICFKSWGGSVNSTFEVDYFDIPELPKAVSSMGKLATTWSAIKR